ncbi:uncharacterized protein Triagg1_3099 [Trichoderma aggressivum f. europaeum]|uniref:ORC1/DEAH AAA+ ATPase domain-containing protein n=1 Tax=Trichoderma aggressivum f. europaeum TaxID=173218 RepID=A0AAE1M7I6_9HYPO|nr:hypothetical protein Triagg1_3099 [Trichoderma aggressivum f. europaeum]
MRRFNISRNQFGNNAFVRQGGIYDNKHLPQSAPTAICVVPYPRNENLVRRPDLMNELNTLLPQASTGCRSAALCGIGGSGKSQIALEYAYQRFHHDTDCSVFWVNAQNEATFLQDYKTIARRFDICEIYLTSIELLRAVRVRIEAQPNWVLILDDADDLRLFDVNQEAEQTRNLVQYIPRASNGTVLWTSRDAHVACILAGPTRHIEVASMSSNEAKELLRITRNLGKSTEEEGDEDEDEAETTALLEKIGWFPLAITQLGAFMRQTSKSTKECLSSLERGQKNWDTSTEGIGKTQVALEAAYRLHAEHPSCSIFWVSTKDAISFENAYYDIGKKLNIEGIDEDEANIKLLVQTALNKESSGTWLLVIDDADALETSRLSHYLPSSPNGSILFVQQKLETPVRLYIPEESIFRIEEITCDEALNLLQKCLKEAQKVETSDIQKLFNFLDKLTSGYERRHRLEEAQKLETELVEARTVIFGDESYVTLARMDNLVRKFQNRGQWKDAEFLELRIIESRKRSLGADDERTLASMEGLALIYKNQGRQEEADKLYMLTRETRKRKLGRLGQSKSLSLTSEPKDLEGDSGYGPASRRATPAAPSVSDLQNGIDDVASPKKSEVKNEISVQLDDTIRSVVTESDDIRSQIPDASTNKGMTGDALISAFLAEQPQFETLCEKALDRMNREVFIKNMSRLLESFHKGLAAEAKSGAERAATGLLRSERSRRQISEQLAAHIDMKQEEARKFYKKDSVVSPSNIQRVERWPSQAVGSLRAGYVPAVDRSRDRDPSRLISEMDSKNTNEPYRFPHISKLKIFLSESKAFQRLQMQFTLMFLSADLRHMLQSIPKENIWLSQEQDVSTSDRLKILVENTTGVTDED